MNNLAQQRIVPYPAWFLNVLVSIHMGLKKKKKLSYLSLKPDLYILKLKYFYAVLMYTEFSKNIPTR